MVKIKNNRLAIGAPKYSGFQGGVYLYRYELIFINPITQEPIFGWQVIDELTGLTSCGGPFGTSFSFREDHNYFLVGSPDGADNFCNAGEVELFYSAPGATILFGDFYENIQTISTSSGGLNNDLLGLKLDCTADRALLGTFSSAKVYKFNTQSTGPDTLSLEQSLGLPNNLSLTDIQIENELIVIGSKANDDSREVCVFVRDGNQWGTNTSLSPSNGATPGFANSISLYGGGVLIGAIDRFYWY